MYNKIVSYQLTKRKKLVESLNQKALVIIAFISTVCVILIAFFIILNGLPTFKTVSLSNFLFSKDWNPSRNTPSYGILSFIVTSFYMTLLSLIIVFPISIATALYLAFFAKGMVKTILQSSVELLSGIPSVIYGLFAIATLVPIIRQYLGGNGYSLLAGSLILALMILPIIVTICANSFEAIPKALIEGSYALGSTKWQTLYKIIIPSAKRGILTGFVLGANRAIGETTAVLMISGNAPLFPESILAMCRTLTMNIITDMSYAEGVHMNSLFATAMVLLIFIIIIDSIAIVLVKKASKGVSSYDL